MNPERVSLLIGAFEFLRGRVADSPELAGGPWTLNLRDLMRWCQATSDSDDQSSLLRTAELLFAERFRTEQDRNAMKRAVAEALGSGAERQVRHTVGISVTQASLTVGRATLARSAKGCRAQVSSSSSTLLLEEQYPVLESLAMCVERGWIPIVVGPPGSGKSKVPPMYN